jgi:malonyl-CoA/methylmalonyl-CoA synthetase
MNQHYEIGKTIVKRWKVLNFFISMFCTWGFCNRSNRASLVAMQNLSKLAISRFALEPRPFIYGDDGRNFSFADFWALAGRLARTLQLAGAVPGDRIAVQVDKSIEAIALFWACARGGFIYLPLNGAYTAAELAYFLGDAEPAVFICDPAKAEALQNIANAAGCKVVLTLDEAQGGSLLAELAAREIDDHASEPDDLVAILYTSGTTGRSKGAMLSHWNLGSNALTLIDTWKFTTPDVLIHALPVHHTHGLFTATNTMFLSGGQMIYQRRFDAEAVMEAMPRATALMGVPTFYTRLLASPRLTREACAHMRLFISGSAPLLAETHRAFSELTGHAILERYGMTETSMNTSNPYGSERRAGTVGFPLPGIAVRINKQGVIEIQGPNVFKGYWRNPAKTAEDMTADGWFVTGDVGAFDKQGYLVISGRAKDLIISGGYNVYPREVEILIDAQAGVLESAVFGVPHPDFGEGVVAVVVAKPSVTLNPATLLSVIKPHLAAFKHPKHVIIVDDLPRNTMGKVQKNLLREIYKGLFSI